MLYLELTFWRHEDTSCIDARHAPSHQRDSHSDDLSIDSSTVVLTYTLPVGSTQANGKRRRRNSSSPDVRSTPHQKDPENNQGEERVAGESHSKRLMVVSLLTHLLHRKTMELKKLARYNSTTDALCTSFGQTRR